MFKKGHLFYGVFKMKCPRCHEGNLFTTPNPYQLKALTTMPERCSHCGQPFQLEPSFYYGSMYVSYGYTVAIFVAVFIISHFVFHLSIWETVAALAAVLLLLSPLLFRLSRSTWIHMFVKFDPKAVQEKRSTLTSEGNSTPSKE
jgi:uncharacterized protein (DUF983 family)